MTHGRLPISALLCDEDTPPIVSPPRPMGASVLSPHPGVSPDASTAGGASRSTYAPVEAFEDVHRAQHFRPPSASHSLDAHSPHYQHEHGMPISPLDTYPILPARSPSIPLRSPVLGRVEQPIVSGQSSHAPRRLSGPGMPASPTSVPHRPSYNAPSPRHPPVSPVIARNPLDVLIHAATVQQDRDRERDVSSTTVLHGLQEHTRTMADDYPEPVPGSSKFAGHRLAQTGTPSEQEDADEWLLDQVDARENASSPIPGSPATVTSLVDAPVPARAAASGAKKAKSRASRPSKRKVPPKPPAVPAPAPAPMDVDVDDELLSLIGESSAGPKASKSRRTKTAAVDADMLFDSPSSSGMRSTPDLGSMPPPPEPPVVKPSGGSKKKGASKSKTQALPIKRQSKPSAKVKANKQVAEPPPSAAPAASRSKKAGGAAARLQAAEGIASRSRSASTKPKAGTEEPAEPVEDQDQEEDDRLYCVCQRRWDENSMMIGCDVCEGWYHPKCIKMEENWIELVDQFVCPNCTADPAIAKSTTWKPRCLAGLASANPGASAACHKPVRADGSKFCSDACGMAYMKARIDGWTHRGGDRGGLWEAVKGAQRLEGVVAIPPTAVAATAPAKDEAAPAALGAARFRPAGGISADAYRPTSGPRAIVQPASGHDRIAREVARLRAQVAQWATRRAALVRELAMLGWREQLFALACARADVRGECGWDQRLCFGDEECAEFGAGVLESYDEHEAADGEDTGQEWWCRGVKKCDRHGGWQKLRSADLAKEKELKEDAINKLTAREADNLQRILEMLAPQTGQLAETNGRSRKEHKVPAVDDATSRGQKRKAD